METLKFERVFEKTTKSKHVHEGVLLVENTAGDFSFNKGYGGKEIDTPFLMASITKLFTTASILILYEQEKLNLRDKMSNYFTDNILDGLHVYKGRDYSHELTISDLLFQTSGLPDAFTEGKNNYTNRIIEADFSFTFKENVAEIKKLKPHFEPNRKGKAYYSDINFDLLGEIIVKVTGISLAQFFDTYIFKPLNMTETYLPEKENDVVPETYYKNQKIHRPQFIISVGASGGAVTTATDLMLFLKAFFKEKRMAANVY